MSNVEWGFDTTGVSVVRAFSDRVNGKTILITGPSPGGIGAKIATDLSEGASPAHIILAGRDLVKIQPLTAELHKLNASIRVDLVQLDLASLESVRKAAKEIADMTNQIHYVFNNAGIMATKDFTKTVDNIEAQFAINHVGHFLLTGLLLPLITKASTAAAVSGDHSLPVRIINLTSNGYIFQGVRFDDYNFQDGKEYGPWLGYGQAKSANIIFAKVLSKKLESFNATSFSATPGLVLETNLQSTVDNDVWASVGEAYDKAWEGRDKPPFEEPKPLACGASTPLRAALDPTLSTTPGEYLMDCKIMDESAKLDHIKGSEVGEKLWGLSEKLVGQTFSVN
ncbi:hypothetical protein TRIATDRAFT_94166 [Trichoderma atroviride IMI 206040]|uniref:Short-chain dehydrogenase n=1 Tax=Hypocrea atroviridis (strain ATCC 20476 / IMI 206040) TaxID=452589 RepID=G9NER8_HYPAI|nr:uncharacterized protein TRIATDRAFT_94166 [Trichoderma atroviride IMI 206040]EHK50799.1 hypothetical protein TRIATDRAFT_94166 [Trichoderma atroviride IMI 206040]